MKFSDTRASQEVDERVVLPGTVGLALAAISVLLTLGSVVAALLLFPEGTPVSADPGAAAIPVWVTILPPLAGILLTLVLPWRPPPMPALPLRLNRLLLTTGVLLALLATFTLAAILVPLVGEGYILGKFLLLMLLPAVLLLVVRNSVVIETRPGMWRWWAPLVVVAVWFYLSQLAPWNPSYDPGEIDPVVLIVAALATAITAGVGEELFFRRWLQTRMEALFGAWAGIGVTSILFGLFHLGSHGTGAGWVDAARVIALQGLFGWFLGVMWWRYRNLLMIILVHLLVNGWGVIAYLVSQG